MSAFALTDENGSWSSRGGREQLSTTCSPPDEIHIVPTEENYALHLFHPHLQKVDVFWTG